MAAIVLNEPCKKCGGVVIYLFDSLLDSTDDRYPNGDKVVDGLCQNCAKLMKKNG